MLASKAHALFIEWGVGPAYGWDTIELDDMGLEGIQTKEDLRTILVENAIRLIDMAVDSPRPSGHFSPYFQWALRVLSAVPMTHDEKTKALGEAARFKPKRNGPHYLSITRKTLKGKPVHVSFQNDRPTRPKPTFPLAG